MKKEPEISGGHGSFCRLCNAWRGSYGLEPTIELYVEHTVEIFREVRRVLKKDGVCFLNLGDSYASGGRTIYGSDSKLPNRGHTFRPGAGRADGKVDERGQRNRNGTPQSPGLKPKDLCGIPWRIALALQADGWWLRSDIIWAKPNPMPESVTDRPTRSHEYIFLLTKSAKYFWDQEAVREPLSCPDAANGSRTFGGSNKNRVGADRGIARRDAGRVYDNAPNGRNLRSVWTIATAPFPEAHFATFPPALVEKCIAAGTSEKGVCPKCGAPWVRVVHRPKAPKEVMTKCNTPDDGFVYSGNKDFSKKMGQGQKLQNWREQNPTTTLRWQPSCKCGYFICPTRCVVIESCQGDKGHDTTHILDGKKMPELWQRISSESARPEILQPEMLRCQPNQGDELPIMREGFQAETSGNPLLFKDLRKSVECQKQDNIQGKNENHEGLCPGINSVPSPSEQDGLCHGTQACNGENDRPVFGKRGSCSSQEQDQRRQQTGKSGINERQGSQQEEWSQVDSSLPPLPEGVPSKRKCEKCGASLIFVPFKEIPTKVLDIFSGSGTTCLVAAKMGRDAIGIELNPEYLDMATQRLKREMGFLIDLEIMSPSAAPGEAISPGSNKRGHLSGF